MKVTVLGAITVVIAVLGVLLLVKYLSDCGDQGSQETQC
jgi:hypothetical protein